MILLYWLMARWALVVHPEVRDWLHEVRKTDRATAALVGQAIQHVVDGRDVRSSTGSKEAGCTT
ncbi:hypothetical protein FDG2_2974 [Candidatus Protofrankia californiensis]|uniref:Uncharacterized protein n=1 Tax=Candidatus Protofrankia californiensis TaxID=1839754 RepID=A0A1C3NYN2_9ACTN|nr:hypothetical protein FDG2_2974 [Candidatus Protofrankia californiensis]